MARHRVSRDQVIWSFGPDLQPVLEVEPGDVVTFETNDCFSGQIRSEDDLVTEIDLGRINSATGPVAVRGAEPGDSLVAEILDVRPVEWGVATLIPGFGQLDHLVQAPLTRCTPGASASSHGCPRCVSSGSTSGSCGPGTSISRRVRRCFGRGRSATCSSSSAGPSRGRRENLDHGREYRHRRGDSARARGARP